MDNEIFVFGSNLEGRHKKGAALEAYQKYGAIMGQGIGAQGRSYAIPTKRTPWTSLPLLDINKYVAEFLIHARANPECQYFVTPIGTGLAGYEANNIAPMFRLATDMKNIILPKEFLYYLKDVDWF